MLPELIEMSNTGIQKVDISNAGMYSYFTYAVVEQITGHF